MKTKAWHKYRFYCIYPSQPYAAIFTIFISGFIKWWNMKEHLKKCETKWNKSGTKWNDFATKWNKAGTFFTKRYDSIAVWSFEKILKIKKIQKKREFSLFYYCCNLFLFIKRNIIRSNIYTSCKKFSYNKNLIFSRF